MTVSLYKNIDRTLINYLHKQSIHFFQNLLIILPLGGYIIFNNRLSNAQYNLQKRNVNIGKRLFQNGNNTNIHGQFVHDFFHKLFRREKARKINGFV